jgi:hypothetical protein
MAWRLEFIKSFDDKVWGWFHLTTKTTFLDGGLHEMRMTKHRAGEAKGLLESNCTDKERKSFN